MKTKNSTLLTFLIFALPIVTFAQNLSSSLQVTARCIGANEVPSVVTDAQALAILTISENMDYANIVFQASGLSGDITGIHIHEGNPGENGGVVLNLGSFLDGFSLNARISNQDDFNLQSLVKGDYYLNVHTEANPGGEIRGQLSVEADLLLGGPITGDQESPPLTADGQGFVSAILSSSNTRLSIFASFDNLTDTITAAHLHNGIVGENGGVVVDLSMNESNGIIEATVDPTDYIDELLAGNIYINVHTAANPFGEIRGQLILKEGLTFDARMNGEQENPSVSTEAKGVIQIVDMPMNSEMRYEGYISQSIDSITGAHLHLGSVGTNGGVVVNLSDTIRSPGQFSGAISNPSKELRMALLRGDIYLNVHTPSNPGGEIRGQVYKTAREGYLAMLNGGQEVPAVSSSGKGVAMVSIDRDETNAHIMAVIDNLKGTFAAAHLHSGAPGKNGGVIFNLTDAFTNGDSTAAFTYWDDFNSDNEIAFRETGVYLNVHTDSVPSGEIRGNMNNGSGTTNFNEFNPKFSGQLLYTGRMSGEQEVPAVVTNANGVGGLLLSADRKTGWVMLSVNGLSSKFAGVHLHDGASGSNGPVIMNLTDFYSQNRVSEPIDISTEMLDKLNHGEIYMNVHSDSFPGGELRTQLILEKDLSMSTTLSGNNEVPAVSSSGRGLATFNLTPSLNQLEVNVMIVGLESSITAAHLHMAQPGENGDVVLNLSSHIDGNNIIGNFDASDILEPLLTGSLYLNIHTEDEPAGELRGQLTAHGGIGFDGWLSGNSSVPPNVSSGAGLLSMWLDESMDTLNVMALTDGLSGEITASHLHIGALGEAGGVWLNLTSGIDSNGISAQFTGIDSAGLSELLKGNIYLNVHTAAYPEGEIRAQAYGLIRDAYQFDICPEQETENIRNAQYATGGGILSLDRKASNMHLMATTSGLTGDIIGMHLHGGGQNENGGVIFSLTEQIENGSIFRYVSIQGASFDEILGAPIRDGNAYLNVHTEANPSGEIRGQVVRNSLCPKRNVLPEVNIKDPGFSPDVFVSSRLSGDQEVPAVTTDAIGVASISFDPTMTLATINVSVANINSPITGIHIHEGQAGENGAVLLPLTDFIQGNRLTASFAVDELFFEGVMYGSLYINVHSEDFPSGEIRGQLQVDAPISFGAAMESNLPDVEGFGIVGLHYSPRTNVLEINAQVNGLSGPITGIHLHRGSSDSIGPVVENLTPYLTGNSVKVKIQAGDYIEDLRTDNIYINVHTATNPEGELRGDLEEFQGVLIDSWLNGAQEVPASENLSIGLALMLIDPSFTFLQFAVVTDNLTGDITGAHIHGGPLNENGDVIFDASDLIQGEFVLTGNEIQLESTLTNALLSGNAYFNVHTEMNPAGEIRGQLYKLARDGYGFDLCPEQETDTIAAPNASGAGVFVYNRDMDEAHLMTVVSGLTSDFAGSHIHEAEPDSNGGVIFNFTDAFMNNGAFVNWTGMDANPFTFEQAALINSGNAYVNIHTNNHPSGELRGQIVKEPNCPFIITSVFNPTNVEYGIEVRPNPASEFLEIVMPDQFTDLARIQIFDLQGRQMREFRSAQSRTERISLTGLTSGLYVLQISGDDQHFIQKFIKQ